MKPFFLIRENFFQSFITKFSLSFYVLSLAKKISYCLSPNYDPELRCVICNGVTLFALVLHLNCTALSQSESSIFSCIFSCIIYVKNFVWDKTSTYHLSSVSLILLRFKALSGQVKGLLLFIISIYQAIMELHLGKLV